MELHMNSNNADLSLELLLNKVQKLIKFWTLPQKLSNEKKKTPKQTKDPLKRQQLEDRVKKYNRNLNLTRKTKANQYNNFFQETNWTYSKLGKAYRKSLT